MVDSVSFTLDRDKTVRSSPVDKERIVSIYLDNKYLPDSFCSSPAKPHNGQINAKTKLQRNKV